LIPVDLVILAKQPPAMPDIGVSDAAVTICRGVAITGHRQIKRAVLCRERAAMRTVKIEVRPR
jgi:hypothetical protein